MASPLSFGAVVALALAGSGAGIYLGKSAISEVNPAYFSTPLPGTRFHSELVANPPALDAPPVLRNAALYEEVKCSGCQPGLYQRYSSIDPADYEFAPIEGDYVADYGDDYTGMGGPVADEAGEQVVTVVRGTEDVVRYAYYQVSSEHEEKDEAVSADPVAVSETGCAADCAGDETPGI